MVGEFKKLLVEAKRLLAILNLPDPDPIEPGGLYYSAETVLKCIQDEREACAKLVEDASAWRGGHGEPPHLSGEALAKMIRDRQ